MSAPVRWLRRIALNPALARMRLARVACASVVARQIFRSPPIIRSTSLLSRLARQVIFAVLDHPPTSLPQILLYLTHTRARLSRGRVLPPLFGLSSSVVLVRRGWAALARPVAAWSSRRFRDWWRWRRSPKRRCVPARGVGGDYDFPSPVQRPRSLVCFGG